MKKRGFGAGRWNGFGGKQIKGETIEETARRELQEESGLEVGDINKLGVMEFDIEGADELLEVHLFKAVEFYGKPRESEEMLPKWFFIEEIPFAEMWADDRYWFPFFMRNKKFKMKAKFSADHKILNYSIDEADDF
jgi:8-oxo-dGTP diphosphatase/2-hydroxy-dATP diphosphatase